MTPLRLFLFAGVTPFVCATTLPVSAHEFWLAPLDYIVEPDTAVAADLRNGQNFTGIKLPYLPNNTALFETWHEGEKITYSGRVGDFPAFQSDGFDAGLLVVVHETTKSRISYATMEKFEAFVQDKGRADILEQHRARGLPETDFTELYSRHVKTLIAVGDGQGADRNFGLKTEIIALTNPYTPNFEGTMQVEWRLDDVPQPNSTVILFDRALAGDVTTTHLETDAQGQLRFATQPGHTYLVDAVGFASAAEESDAVWETYWAALTFQVPE